MKYTFCHALCHMYPELAYSMRDPDDISTLDIQSNAPSDGIDLAAISAWLDSKNALEPMRLLREERSRRLVAVDWVVIKYTSLGQQIPQEWADYMQALRDLPAVSSPQLNEYGALDMTSVTFPTLPM